MAELAMAELDRATARALVEAGYMSLAEYIARFGGAAQSDPLHVESPSTAPDACEARDPVLQALTITERR
jgi:hypothetical protein